MALSDLGPGIGATASSADGELISWTDIFDSDAAGYAGRRIAIDGWMMPFDGVFSNDGGRAYFLILPEPAAFAIHAATGFYYCIEAFASRSLPETGARLRFSGRLIRLLDDRSGYAFQLRDVSWVDIPTIEERNSEKPMAPLLRSVSPERERVASGDLPSGQSTEAVESMLDRLITVDIHSHAGRLAQQQGQLWPVAQPMRQGRMSAICLAVIGDAGTIHLTTERRIEVFRRAEPGELHRHAEEGFARVARLVRHQGLAVITDAGGFRAAGCDRPAVIVASEGADFLEGDIDNLDAAFERHHLRHLQLMHYRVNELGDLQTMPPVYHGLSDFGAAVVRRCCRLGIVIDVAYATDDLARQAAEIADKPLVLSHGALTEHREPYGRGIETGMARLVAATGGLLGVWPRVTDFPDLASYVAGIARMVDLVGIDHVGIGSDLLGLTVPASFSDYRQLPDLVAVMQAFGFNPDEVAKILGGNYVRVFDQYRPAI